MSKNCNKETCEKEVCCQEGLTAQQKIDAIVEEKQLKYYTSEHLDTKFRLEAENEILQLKINNYAMKSQLAQLKKQATGLTGI